MNIRSFFTIILLLCATAFVSSCGGGASTATNPGLALSAATDNPLLETGGAANPVLMEAPASAGKREGGIDTAPGAPPAAGASGGPSYNSYYVPANAFDGNYKSWWVGQSGAGAWDLYYGFKTTVNFRSISVNFYSAQHQPAQTVVYVSPNGTTWKQVGTLTPGGPTTIATNKSGMYLRLSMSGNPAIGYPLIRDVDWTPVVENAGAYAEPGYNDNNYFASNAVDGDPNTWWAGAVNAGAWDFYYGFSQPTVLGTFQVTLYNAAYRPTSMKLLVSNDGLAWQDLGELSAGAAPFMYVNQAVSYFRIQMAGNPQTGYPLIKDIAFGNAPGAFGGPNYNDFYIPANAFDGNLSTWWTGQQGATRWELFYNYAAARTVNTVAIDYYSLNHVPATATLYVSADGANWTEAGTFAHVPTPSLAVGATAKNIRIVFDGAPLTGFPLIRDISIN